jgi:hypothetical protein
MLSDLLEAEGRLVAHLEPLPFQEGRQLATAAEGRLNKSTKALMTFPPARC